MSSISKKEDPRITRTRNLILESFGQLLTKKGFDTITIQDLTDKVQINRATFYAHFQDKYALLDYFVSQLLRQKIDARALGACQYSPDNLKILILTVVEFRSQVRKDWANATQTFDALVEGAIKKLIFDLFMHWLDKLKTGVSHEISATVAASAIYGLANYYSRAKKRPALEKFVDEAFLLVAVNLEQFA